MSAKFYPHGLRKTTEGLMPRICTFLSVKNAFIAFQCKNCIAFLITAVKWFPDKGPFLVSGVIQEETTQG